MTTVGAVEVDDGVTEKLPGRVAVPEAVPVIDPVRKVTVPDPVSDSVALSVAVSRSDPVRVVVARVIVLESWVGVGLSGGVV